LTRDEYAFYYYEAVKNEKRKIDLGVSNILNLVTLEDKLISSLVSVISAKLKFSKALANLRFEAGELPPWNEDYEISFGMEKLTDLPFGMVLEP